MNNDAAGNWPLASEPKLEFQQEYACRWIDVDPRQRQLDALADHYVTESEAYDQTISPYRNRRGIAMPRDGRERQAMQKFAYELSDRLFHEVVRGLGFTLADWSAAIRCATDRDDRNRAKFSKNR